MPGCRRRHSAYTARTLTILVAMSRESIRLGAANWFPTAHNLIKGRCTVYPPDTHRQYPVAILCQSTVANNVNPCQAGLCRDWLTNTTWEDTAMISIQPGQQPEDLRQALADEARQA